jgi:hypothetical protein
VDTVCPSVVVHMWRKFWDDLFLFPESLVEVLVKNPTLTHLHLRRYWDWDVSPLCTTKKLLLESLSRLVRCEFWHCTPPRRHWDNPRRHWDHGSAVFDTTWVLLVKVTLYVFLKFQNYTVVVVICCHSKIIYSKLLGYTTYFSISLIRTVSSSVRESGV